jgi:hypothetical protein
MVANRTIDRWLARFPPSGRRSIIVAMAATPRFPRPSSFQAAAVQSLLATERDAHRRQRELVRASLVMCPGKGATRAARHAA